MLIRSSLWNISFSDVIILGKHLSPFRAYFLCSLRGIGLLVVYSHVRLKSFEYNAERVHSNLNSNFVGA